MPVTLSKVIDGKPVDTVNGFTVRCPRCEQAYWLAYTDDEWHRVDDWVKLARAAIEPDHDLRHEALTIALKWRGIRSRALGQPNLEN